MTFIAFKSIQHILFSHHGANRIFDGIKFPNETHGERKFHKYSWSSVWQKELNFLGSCARYFTYFHSEEMWLDSCIMQRIKFSPSWMQEMANEFPRACRLRFSRHLKHTHKTNLTLKLNLPSVNKIFCVNWEAGLRLT